MKPFFKILMLAFMFSAFTGFSFTSDQNQDSNDILLNTIVDNDVGVQMLQVNRVDVEVVILDSQTVNQDMILFSNLKVTRSYESLEGSENICYKEVLYTNDYIDKSFRPKQRATQHYNLIAYRVARDSLICIWA